MFRLIESIRLDEGVFQNLHLHQLRMNASVLELASKPNVIDLESYLSSVSFPVTGTLKCRIVYNENGIEQVEFIPYSIRPVGSLKVKHDNQIQYKHKFENRSGIENLVDKRDDCDDIIIVKNGQVTDASYSNLVFFDGLHWITPSSPLLNGIMRKLLLDAGEIKEDILNVDDIPLFRKVKLINALLGFNGPELSVSQIVF